jgi:hypothetical protein
VTDEQKLGEPRKNGGAEWRARAWQESGGPRTDCDDDDEDEEGVGDGDEGGGEGEDDLAEGAHAAEEADDAEGAHEADDADGHVDGAERDEREGDDEEVEDRPPVPPEGSEPVRVHVDKQLQREDSGEHSVDPIEDVSELLHKVHLRNRIQIVSIVLSQFCVWDCRQGEPHRTHRPRFSRLRIQHAGQPFFGGACRRNHH